MEQALKLIITKSPNAMSEAITCLRAIAAKSPVVQQRYQHCLTLALNDPAAKWTAQERAILAEPLTANVTDTKSVTVAIRLTPEERHILQQAADQSDQTLSDYIRSKLFA